ncbi:amidase [Agromyces sp. CCNWLW203]|uniref:amidase n=1 Tax=Agromyces sp. CCNWLW203 TaxID=3112842 RepID=UPI002F961A72
MIEAPHTTSSGDARAQAIDRAEAAMRQHADANIVITNAIDRARDVSSGSGVLDGFTVALKDMIDVAGLPTTRGSALYGGLDALATAPCVDALQQAGAVIVAKVNLHEFAYGVTNENPHWGDVVNPRHPDLIAGGSSGGTAAAIAAGIARVGLGTDTAGSIRMPAACCGVVGLRPRTGRVSGRGVAGLAPSFDVVGPMAATVEDTARTWAVLSGEPVPDAAALHGLVIGVIEGCAAADRLRALGAEIRSFELPGDLLDPFWTMFRAEATRTHEGTFPRNAADYSANVRAKLENASGVDAGGYQRARDEIDALRGEVARRMHGLDLLVSDTLGCAAPPVGCDEVAIRDDLGRLVAPFSALDLPALAIGNLQIVARTEADALAAGLAWEREVGEIPPPW